MAPGLEALALAELRSLGITDAAPEPGGVAFAGTLRDLYGANLHLRTASRVLVRAAEFRAASFGELERRAGRVAWSAFLTPGVGAHFEVTCRKSRLYHSGAVAERLARASGTAPDGGATPDAPTQRFVVRLVRDRLTLSADASGEHLHRRGYREATAKAPLRETLAAAMLMASGWTPDQALVDPLCGSGTLAIEAALMARRVPPGWRRSFAFERWPGFDEALWRDVRAQAGAAIAEHAAAPIVASDRDAGAVAAARANATRAGVEGDIAFATAPLSAARPPEGWTGGGWLVTNPPWGQRVGDRTRLRDLYAALGALHRGHFAGWGLTWLTAAPELAAQVGGGPHPEVLLETRSGGVSVRLYRQG